MQDKVLRSGLNPMVHLLWNWGRRGMPLGVIEESSWNQSEIILGEGDVLLLYTDGITEACNRAGDYVGLQHLKECVNPIAGRGADEIISTIEKELQHFLSGEPPQDDVTLMVIKRTA